MQGAFSLGFFVDLRDLSYVKKLSYILKHNQSIGALLKGHCLFSSWLETMLNYSMQARG